MYAKCSCELRNSVRKMETFGVLRKVMIRPFELFGVWPKSSSPLLYHLWTLTMFLVVGIAFPFSQLINCLFVDSVAAFVGILLVTSTVTVVVAKSVIIYKKRSKLVRLLSILKRLDSEVHELDHVEILNRVLRQCLKIYYLFLFIYVFACVILTFQALLVPKEYRMWPSTVMYPYKWAQVEGVYIGGIVFQGIANTLICVFSGSGDTYGINLSNILVAHIRILCLKLERLRETEIVKCCQTYEDILR